MSPVVQALPSSHAAVLLVWTAPVAGLHVSSVQGLPSSTTRGPAAACVVPPPRRTPVVQALPSLHGAVLLVWTAPVAGLHVSSVQTLLSSTTRAPAPGWQLPPPQVSPVVQALPSLHGAVLLVWTAPVAGLHVSSVHTLP